MIDASALVDGFRGGVEPPPLNPVAQEAEDLVIDWLRRLDFVTSEAQEQHLREFKFGLYHALATPGVDLAHLTIGMKWFCWGSLADDQYDNYEGPAWELRMQGVLRDIRRVLAGRRSVSAASNPVVVGLESYWPDLTAGLSRTRQRRIAGHFLDYMQAIVLQNRYHAARRIPDPATFLTLRRHTIAMIFQADVLEIVSQIDAPDAMRESLAYRELVLCFADVLAWHNDVYGLEKDVADGQTCNAVLVVADSEGCSTDEAVERVLHRARERQRLFLEIEAQLPDVAASLGLPPAAAAEAARLAQDLRRYAFANLVWVRETARYDLARPRIEGTFDDVILTPPGDRTRPDGVRIGSVAA
jgi:5-epi-alpha-selinene synthase